MVAAGGNTRLVGVALPRADDPRLVTGRGAFVDDLRVPGTLHAAFLRSAHAHARVRTVATEAAETLTGVRAVFGGQSPEMRALPPLRPRLTTPGVVCPARPLLAADVVRFVGEALGVVVADSRYLAEDALDLIPIDYEPLDPVVSAEAALRDDAARLHTDVPGNRYVERTFETGGVDTAFEGAEITLNWRRFATPRTSGAPLEMRAVLAVPREGGGITLWSSTQSPHRVREVVAHCLGLAETAVRVVAPDVGGGFGVKAQVYPEELIVAWLARRLGRPVKWIEDRREHLLAAGHAREQIVEARLAACRDGRVTAIDARVICDIGAYGVYPFGPALEPLATGSMLTGPYDIHHYRCRALGAATNKSPEGPYRGVGLPVSTFVHERLMDLLAGELGLEPAELRRRNLVPADAFPYTSASGMVYDSGRYGDCLDRAVTAIDLPGWRQRQLDAATTPVRLGIGIGCYVEYTGLGTPTYRGRGMLSVPGSDGVRLRVKADGRVLIASSLTEMGQGIQTTLRQLAADGLGLPIEAVEFVNTDTDQAPPGTGTFASRSAVLGSRAMATASEKLRARILDVAAEVFEADATDLELVNGTVRVRGAPEVAVSLSALAARADLDVSVEDPGPAATFPYATHIGVVEVDRWTGRSRWLAYVVAEDCGPVINPLIVEGQVQGAVAQGIGGALLEELQYDAAGQLLSASLMDYLLPTATDVPRMQVEHLETPSPLVPGGFKGVGEGGTLAPPALVANALSDALRIEVNVLPATPERILALQRT